MLGSLALRQAKATPSPGLSNVLDDGFDLDSMIDEMEEAQQGVQSASQQVNLIITVSER